MIRHKAAARNCGAGKVHLKNETVTAGTRLAFPTGSRMQQPLLGCFPGGGSSVLSAVKMQPWPAAEPGPGL